MNFKHKEAKRLDNKFADNNYTTFAEYDPINPKKQRIPQHVVENLESIFSINPRPNTAYLRTLVKEVQLDLKKLKTWFQNRRAKQKRDSGSLSLQTSTEYSCSNITQNGEIPLAIQYAPTPQHFSNNTPIAHFGNCNNFFSDVNQNSNIIAPSNSSLKLMNNLAISPNLQEFGNLYLDDLSSSISPTANFNFSLGCNLNPNFGLSCLPQYMDINSNTNSYNLDLTDPNFYGYGPLNLSTELLTNYNYSLHDSHFNALPMFNNPLNQDFVITSSSINSSNFEN